MRRWAAVVAAALVAIGVAGACRPDGEQSAGAGGGGGGAAARPAARPAGIEIPAEFTERPIDVAIYDNLVPAGFVEDGELIGFNVDLTLALEETLGVDFDIHRVSSFDLLLPGLLSGRFDIAAGLYVVTPARLEVVDLVTMVKVGIGFATAADGDLTIDSPDDLCGLDASTVGGTVFPDELAAISAGCEERGQPGVAVHRFLNSTAAVLAMAAGRADVYVSSVDEIAYLVTTTEGLRQQPYVFHEQLEATAVAKGSPLAEAIRAGYDALIADGTYDAILDKWGVGAMAVDRAQINPVEPGIAD